MNIGGTFLYIQSKTELKRAELIFLDEEEAFEDLNWFPDESPGRQWNFGENFIEWARWITVVPCRKHK